MYLKNEYNRNSKLKPDIAVVMEDDENELEIAFHECCTELNLLDSSNLLLMENIQMNINRELIMNNLLEARKSGCGVIEKLLVLVTVSQSSFVTASL